MRPALKILLLLQLASAAALTLNSPPALHRRRAALRGRAAAVPADPAWPACKATRRRQEDGEAVVDALLALESGAGNGEGGSDAVAGDPREPERRVRLIFQRAR